MTAMTSANLLVWLPAAAAALLGLLLVLRHCDSMGGPVVADARKALDAGDATRVLKWVGPEQEAELREAFRRVRDLREAGGGAGETAERYFLETAVRLHRAHEGASYTGLRPAEDIPPAVVAADEAVETGSPDELIASLSSAVERDLRERFERVRAARPESEDDVEAGRRWVREYTDFVHRVLHVSQAVGGLEAASAPRGEAADKKRQS